VPLFLLTWLFGASAWPVFPVTVVVLAANLALPLALSAAVFARTDWQRRIPRPASRAAAEGAPAGPTSWAALLWLAFRQGRGRVKLRVLAVAAVVAGVVLPAYGPYFWPPVTLLVGVVCGTAVFRGEQADGAYRFLGDQRFPVVRVWAAKVGFWLAAALGVAAL